MVEETQEEEIEEEQEETPAEEPAGDIIKEAREERMKLEKVRDELRAENERKERNMVRDALGGKTEAGGVKEKPKEESAEDYKNRIMSGGI